jgi:hypothetical protein
MERMENKEWGKGEKKCGRERERKGEREKGKVRDKYM